MKKICGVIPEQELKKILKNKNKTRFTGRCSDCPLFVLEEKLPALSCTQIIQHLCGKTPTRCSEAISLLYNFLNKFRNKQNKI